MSISPEKIQEVLDQHSRRLLNNMSQEELYSFALQSMKQSFDQNPGVGDTDVGMLISSIMQEEDYVKDSASEFLTGCGLEDGEVDEIIQCQDCLPDTYDIIRYEQMNGLERFLKSQEFEQFSKTLK